MPSRETATKTNRQSKAVGQKPKDVALEPRAGSKPGQRSVKATEMMHVRVPDRLKKDATRTLEQIGMTLPDALRLFMHRVVVEQALPLRLAVPNTVTRAALDASMKARTSRFSTPQAMFDALEKTGER